MSTRRTLRGTAPGTYAQIAEIMSGTTDSQQGLVATCKDSLSRRRSESAMRDSVGRMSPYEL